MSELERQTLRERFAALTTEEKKIAISYMDDEVLLEELTVRLKMAHMLTDKVLELRRVVTLDE